MKKNIFNIAQTKFKKGMTIGGLAAISLISGKAAAQEPAAHQQETINTIVLDTLRNTNIRRIENTSSHNKPLYLSIKTASEFTNSDDMYPLLSPSGPKPNSARNSNYVNLSHIQKSFDERGLFLTFFPTTLIDKGNGTFEVNTDKAYDFFRSLLNSKGINLNDNEEIDISYAYPYILCNNALLFVRDNDINKVDLLRAPSQNDSLCSITEQDRANRRFTLRIFKLSLIESTLMDIAHDYDIQLDDKGNILHAEGFETEIPKKEDGALDQKNTKQKKLSLTYVLQNSGFTSKIQQQAMILFNQRNNER